MKSLKLHISTLFVFLALLLTACSNNPSVADGEGNASETIAMGTIYDSNMNPAAMARVSAIPYNNNPVTNGPIPDSLIDTTDDNGVYQIIIPDSGAYNFYAASTASGTSELITGVHISDDTVLVPDGTLKEPGSIRVPLPPSPDLTNGYIYIEGTDISAQLQTTTLLDGFIVLDAVPAVSTPKICYAELDNSQGSLTIAENVGVISGNTVTLNPITGNTDMFIGIADTGASYAIISDNRNSFDYRFAVLTNDVHSGWYTWRPNGAWATEYINASSAMGLKPAFVYEQSAIFSYDHMIGTFANGGFMLCVYEDLERLFSLASGSEAMFILEPFLLGFTAKKWYAGEVNLADIFANVKSSTYPTVQEFDDTYFGFWDALFTLSERFAPDAKVGVFLDNSGFTVGSDSSGPAFWTPEEIDSTARLWRILLDEIGITGRIDFISIGKDSIDAGFGGPNSWGATQMENFKYYAAALHREFNLPLIGWYIPIGHTGLPNEINRYEDTFAEYFFDASPSFQAAGFAGILFGKYDPRGTDLSDSPGTGDDGWFINRLSSWSNQ